MSIIADAEAMRGFASFIRADTERIRRSIKNGLRGSLDDVVEISEEAWSVIIVETKEAPPEDVTLGEGRSCALKLFLTFLPTSAATYRVRELSGPLAKAGISILYQVSAPCDLIMRLLIIFRLPSAHL